MNSSHLDDDQEEQASVGRTTVDIYADILEVVKRHGGHGRVTRISYGVGMPVDRLKKFLDKLERFGLVRSDPSENNGSATFLMTPRGQEFLDTYWRMRGFLDILEDDAMR